MWSHNNNIKVAVTHKIVFSMATGNYQFIIDFNYVIYFIIFKYLEATIEQNNDISLAIKATFPQLIQHLKVGRLK